ncbi:MAG: sigma-54 dependent transcriptional regulator [Acidobacteriota bacterium]
MTAPLSEDDVEYAPRRRDRREAFGELVASLTRTLGGRGDVALMRGAFEQALRRLVPVHSVQLRESTSRWLSRPDSRGSAESISLDVPGVDAASQGILEARFDPGCRLGEWDFQMLGVAAHLGALVLEIERGRSRLARAGLSGSKPRREDAAPLIGSTTAMHALRAKIERVAATDFTVLLEGESGVGKELVARQIHDLSRRRHGPFVAVNCAALVETLLEAELFGIEERTATGVKGRRGKFEHADSGTLFLDEVSDLSVSAQAKLLRAIQDLAVERVGGTTSHRLDIRIVAATNRSLLGLVDRQLFRPDLYYRLSGVDLIVPPLRERRGDILELAGHFLERHRQTRPLALSTAAADALAAYDWPGNVRELERLIERSVALAATDVIEIEDLPPVVRGDYALALMPSIDRRETLRAWGSRYVRLVLGRCHGNKREACRVLDISYHTLQGYLRYRLASAVEAGSGWEAGGRPDEHETQETEVPAGTANVEA